MMFKKILIANRGEIAIRIARTCRDLGIATVAVYSEADVSSPHVYAADEAVCIGPPQATESYLNIDAILAAAKQTGASAIHPGYGFLSENHTFAQRARDVGLTFIGPSPEALSAVGNKVFARQAVAKLGVPVIPALEKLPDDPRLLQEQVRTLGYPLLIKAASGGGGKGMRIVRQEKDLAEAVAAAQREALSAFAEGTVYLERYIEKPRHIEVQILGDTHGTLIHLGERECSIQRRYQKILEETPSPAVDEKLRETMTTAALTVAKAASYYNAGTVEFILDDQGRFYFLEVNARLQVEHPITEWITGLDLVREQIRIAAGERLGFGQEDILRRGHALECRIYAEDPAHGFLPAPGKVLLWKAPAGPGVRVDAGVDSNTEVSVYYDPMIAKLSTWGQDREQARRRMESALRQCVILGPITNSMFLLDLLAHPAFVAGKTHTGFLSEHFAQWQGEEAPHFLSAALVATLNQFRLAHRGISEVPISSTTPWQQLGGWRMGV
ncbi:MAG: acetyl/propionyl/methylcrotonyl-CoA carboxylase subunit alpha [Candidatus Binatia bacterium]